MKDSIYHAFIFSIIRHILSMLTGVLVSWGVLTAETANEFTTTAAVQIAAGVLTFGAALWLSYRDKIWQFLKLRIGIWMPPNTDPEIVAEIASTVDNKAEVARGGAEPPEGMFPTPPGGRQ
jgi:ABC-type nickel/cobalt efflux system permease component RcnA